jgi:pimeloyl-ACP methyl ester carboxylesterase
MLGRWLKRLLILVVILLMIGAGAFTVWASILPPVDPRALEALKESPEVVVNQEEWIEFLPQVTPARTGLILYPGGKVPAEAYAPMARMLADEGYYVAILYAPLNLAILNTEAAQAVFTAHKDVSTWVVGGHSLGGVAAAKFAENHMDRVRGLLLMASTPQDAGLLNKTSLPITSIYATNDGLFTAQSLEQSKALLPPQTTYVAIEGGNHAQFGWYGPQAGDNPATMSPDEQLIQIVNATRTLLEAAR